SRCSCARPDSGAPSRGESRSAALLLLALVLRSGAVGLGASDRMAPRDRDAQRSRSQTHAHVGGLAELVAVELNRPRVARADVDAVAAGVANRTVAGAQRQDAPPGAEPPQHAVVPRDAA